MQTRTSVSKAQQKQEGVHRLTEMLVEEVSLVDRAANQRKFLIVKRAAAQKGSDMPTEVTPNGNGGFTSSNPAAKGAPPKGKDETKKGKIEKLDAVPPGFKQMMSPLLAKASELLSALADAVSKAGEGEVDEEGALPPVPAEFSGELTRVIRLLDQAANMWPSAPPKAEEGEPPPPDGEMPPADLEMREKALSKLAKAMGVQVSPAQLRKVGAKMSKERLSRFEGALNTLGDLISELRSAPPAPAEKAQADEEETEKRMAKAIEAALQPVAEALQKLGAVVKKQHGDIETIQKGRPSGNSLPVETKTPVAKSEDSVSWPLDMNNPRFSREKVSKEESFFGED